TTRCPAACKSPGPGFPGFATGGNQPARQKIEGGCHSADGCCRFLAKRRGLTNGNDGLTADPLDLSPAESLVGVLLHPLQFSGNYLELQTRTAGVENENVHSARRLASSIRVS